MRTAYNSAYFCPYCAIGINEVSERLAVGRYDVVSVECQTLPPAKRHDRTDYRCSYPISHDGSPPEAQAVNRLK